MTPTLTNLYRKAYFKTVNNGSQNNKLVSPLPQDCFQNGFLNHVHQLSWGRVCQLFLKVDICFLLKQGFLCSVQIFINQESKIAELANSGTKHISYIRLLSIFLDVSVFTLTGHCHGSGRNVHYRVIQVTRSDSFCYSDKIASQCLLL